MNLFNHGGGKGDERETAVLGTVSDLFISLSASHFLFLSRLRHCKRLGSVKNLGLGEEDHAE